MRPKKLTSDEIAESAIEAPDWTVSEGRIQRAFQFTGFPLAIAFVNSVAAAAEAMTHHPDIDIRYRPVTLSLSTHDAGGLTALDFELAKQIDRLV